MLLDTTVLRLNYLLNYLPKLKRAPLNRMHFAIGILNIQATIKAINKDSASKGVSTPVGVRQIFRKHDAKKIHVIFFDDVD